MLDTNPSLFSPNESASPSATCLNSIPSSSPQGSGLGSGGKDNITWQGGNPLFAGFNPTLLQLVLKNSRSVARSSFLFGVCLNKFGDRDHGCRQVTASLSSRCSLLIFTVSDCPTLYSSILERRKLYRLTIGSVHTSSRGYYYCLWSPCLGPRFVAFFSVRLATLNLVKKKKQVCTGISSFRLRSFKAPFLCSNSASWESRSSSLQLSLCSLRFWYQKDVRVIQRCFVRAASH
jgi:hypothetical protein